MTEDLRELVEQPVHLGHAVAPEGDRHPQGTDVVPFLCSHRSYGEHTRFYLRPV